MARRLDRPSQRHRRRHIWKSTPASVFRASRRRKQPALPGRGQPAPPVRRERSRTISTSSSRDGSVSQVLLKESDRRLDAPDFDRLLLDAVWVGMVAAPNFAAFDASKTV